MANAVDTAVATRLAAAVAGLVLADGSAANANLFTGPERAAGGGVPEKAVFCRATGGPAPVPYCGSARTSFHRARVQVLIRGDREPKAAAFTDGQTLARQCLDALRIPAITDYARCRVMESAPNYLGQDDQDHHRWSVNAELWFEE